MQRGLPCIATRLQRCLVITDAPVWRSAGFLVQQALDAAGIAPLSVCDDVITSNPTLTQVQAVLSVAQRVRCTSLIAVGGGSVIDVAKLVLVCLAGGIDVCALHTPHGLACLQSCASTQDPVLLAIPTTAGTGSESSTAALIVGEGGSKRLYRSHRFLPTLTLLQPELTLGLPARTTALSGFDAVLHALGAWINTDPSPVGKAMALQALRLCLQAYPRVLQTPDAIDARATMQIAAWMAGVAIGISKADAVHGLCTPLETVVHKAHAEVLAPVFVAVAPFTAQTHAQAYAEAAWALGLSRARSARRAAAALIDAVADAAQAGDIATRFESLALSAPAAHQLALQALQSDSTRLHPRPLSVDQIAALYLQMTT